ncbi:MAG: NADH-quinone oxidoreductase subunit L [Hyphomicrobiaceae bacterium]|jgi:NADH-quinone oxidoreductase subunit L
MVETAHAAAMHAETVFTASNSLRWIVLVPLLGSIINFLLGARIQKAFGRAPIALIGTGASLAAFGIVVANFFTLRAMDPSARILVDELFPWMQIGNLDVSIAFQLDPLSAVMTLVVTGIGSLIHIYSYGYMDHEPAVWRFFALLNLFMFAMLTLVLGDNMLVMFVGWEGVGLCSWGLIGFWHSDHTNTNAANKAFLVNRIGDFTFLLGMFALFWTLAGEGVATLTFRELTHAVGALEGHTVLGMTTATFVTLFLFIGATGKSAQIPLYVWLPDAMAGPTPVSALIHAATMVTAGVYMIARLNFLFSMAPVTMEIIAFIGAATALFAATIGLTQYDIKKVLAYSTVSQLGYMFMAMGVGAYGAGVFHLVTHAFFKACLFLGSGSVIHAMHHEQDMRNMGGLRHYMPITFGTFFISTLAIAGLPPFAGFFSKDEILWQAWLANPLLWAIGFLAAGMTAFYMFRQVFMTFFGECRADEHVKEHLHESSASMTIPLIVLAAGAISIGWLGIPAALGGNNHFEKWLEPVMGQHQMVAVEHAAPADGDAHATGHAVVDDHATSNAEAVSHSADAAHGGGHGDHDPMVEYGLMASSIAMALGGIFLAWLMYSRKSLDPDRFARIAGGVPYRLSFNKYYVDEIYYGTFLAGTLALARALSWFDRTVVDGIVNGVARVTSVISNVHAAFDTYIVDGLVNGTAAIIDRSGGGLRLVQSGSINAYLYVIMLAVTVALLARAW